jgi:hypothetical protein
MSELPKYLRWGPYDDTRGWVRGGAISLAAAVFMTFVGAFGTDRAGIGVRLLYWLALMSGGWLWGMVVSRYFFHKIAKGSSVWWRVAAASLVLALPFSLVVRYASIWALHGNLPLSEFPALVVSVTGVAFAMMTINVLVARQGTGATSASATPPKFLDRLPLKLRGAEIWGVEAEDHYLRLHTSKGQDLILMRLSDAIAELEGIEGAQVHRSWWISRDAITDARRGDGRAVLTLKDGAEVPVSRTYAGMLRERGWI